MSYLENLNFTNITFMLETLGLKVCTLDSRDREAKVRALDRALALCRNASPIQKYKLEHLFLCNESKLFYHMITHNIFQG